MITVAIVFGGPGSEHEVSLSSAKNILENIDRELYDVLQVFVTKEVLYIIEGVSFSEDEGIKELKNRCVQVVFPVFHGEYGEGGVVQKKLETHGLPFVGSQGEASAIAIDKHATSRLFKQNGVNVPEEQVVTKDDHVHRCSYPIFVKPLNEGSSVGLFKFEEEKKYFSFLDIIFNDHAEMLVQEFIEGREFTCGVIEKEGETIPLLATEVILTKGKLFDYEAKYTPEGCKEVTPADVDEVLMKKIQEVAVSCHTIMGCKSFSRTDMILHEDQLYVLEINTIPGMTKTSFIPAQAKASGYSMKELLTILITSALIRKIQV